MKIYVGKNKLCSQTHDIKHICEEHSKTLTWKGMWMGGPSLQALGTQDMHRVVKARPFLQKNV